jgi:hypothetical protein
MYTKHIILLNSYLIDAGISSAIADKMYPLIGIQVGNKYAERRELD